MKFKVRQQVEKKQVSFFYVSNNVLTQLWVLFWRREKMGKDDNDSFPSLRRDRKIYHYKALKNTLPMYMQFKCKHQILYFICLQTQTQ